MGSVIERRTEHPGSLVLRAYQFPQCRLGDASGVRVTILERQTIALSVCFSEHFLLNMCVGAVCTQLVGVGSKVHTQSSVLAAGAFTC